MKKVIVALLAVILVSVLGLGGYFIWKVSSKIDKKSEEIIAKIDEVNSSSSSNQVNNNVAVNNTVAANNVVANNQVDNNNTLNNQIATNNTVVNNQTNTNLPIDEQIKNAYGKRLSQNQNILEYKIESVTVLSDEQKKSILEYDKGQYYTEADTLAVVGYSVRLKDINANAGNGEVSGDWIIKKSACVSYRDGEIKQDGTGW